MGARRRAAQRADDRPPRVVFDTNVVLSALVFGKGVTAQFRTAWAQADFEITSPCACLAAP